MFKGTKGKEPKEVPKVWDDDDDDSSDFHEMTIEHLNEHPQFRNMSEEDKEVFVESFNQTQDMCRKTLRSSRKLLGTAMLLEEIFWCGPLLRTNEYAAVSTCLNAEFKKNKTTSPKCDAQIARLFKTYAKDANIASDVLNAEFIRASTPLFRYMFKEEFIDDE